jgi:hypothetical protein
MFSGPKVGDCGSICFGGGAEDNCDLVQLRFALHQFQRTWKFVQNGFLNCRASAGRQKNQYERAVALRSFKNGCAGLNGRDI